MGILIRETIVYWHGPSLKPTGGNTIETWVRSNPTRSSETNFIGQLFWIYLAIVMVIAEYWNAFGWKEFVFWPFVETMYYPSVSSREYFGSSILLATSILFPMAYALAEEHFRSEKGYIPIWKSWKTGLLIGFFIQSIVLTLQFFYSLEWFSAGSNQTLASQRLAGLFLDSGSASWILPVIGYIFIDEAWSKFKDNKDYFQLALCLIVLIWFMTIGTKLGKTFWVELILLTSWFIYKRIPNVRWKPFLLLTIPFLFALTIGISKFFPGNSSLHRLGEIQLKFFQNFSFQDPFHSISSFDRNRGALLKANWDQIKKEPIWGTGWGSFPMLLKDPDFDWSYFEVPVVDMSPTLYLSIIGDLGIFGSLLVIAIFLFGLWERQNLSYVALLTIPFLFGTHIQHADGAFVVIFLLFSNSFEPEFRRFKYQWFKPSVVVVLLLLPLHYLVHTIDMAIGKGKGFNFRFEELGFYQLGAYEWSVGGTHHRFQGNSWQWKLAPKGRYLNVMLEGASGEVELIFVDSNGESLSRLSPGQEKEGLQFRSNVPKGAITIKIQAKNNIKFQVAKKEFDLDNCLLLN